MSDARLARGAISLSGTYRRPEPVVAQTPRSAGEARLERALREDSTGFEFFQAVRLLERLNPGRAPVGGWADPNDEVARFAVNPSLGFPVSEIQTLSMPEDGGVARLTINFIGLTGPQGVLPHVYTEHAAVRARARDTAFRDFLDIFHHRAISLFYRAWVKHRAAVMHESGGEDRLYDHLLDLAGVGTAGLRGRLPVPDAALAFYSGLLSTQIRSADGLARLVSDYFGVAASVEQFVGEWRRVDAGGQCTLGEEDASGQLGFGVLGDAAWDPHSSVRLRLGPLTRPQFDAFLPGGDAHAALSTLARLYANDEVGVQAQLVLARDAVSPCRLDGSRGTTTLGRGTWLASKPLSRDPDETTLALC